MIMDEINSLVLILRWLHWAAAIVAVGGAAFMRFALIPAAKQALDPAAHERLREAVRARWAPFVHGSIAVLLITGLLNFYFLVLEPGVKPMPYHAIFGVKFLLAIFVFFIAEALIGKGAGLAAIKQARAGWLIALLAAAAIIVFLSGVLNQVRMRSPGQSSTARTSAPS